MKKLMMAAAIVCAAVSAQASSVMWESVGVKAYSGKNVYLLTSLAESYKDEAAVQKAALDYGSIAKVGMSYKMSARTVTDERVTDKANYYIAVISEDGQSLKYTDVSESMRALVYNPPTSSPGTQSSKYADILSTGSSIKIGTDPEPTPEPTSAMLMLLGVAGLALRRKQK